MITEDERALLMTFRSIRVQITELREEIVALDLPFDDAVYFLHALSRVELRAANAAARLVSRRDHH